MEELISLNKGAKDIVGADQPRKIEDGIAASNTGRIVLRIDKGVEDSKVIGALDRLAQKMNIANIVGHIEQTAEYVVQIPAKYQKQFEAGELFINKNKTTGIEWPTLMKKAENGRYQFVDNLPIKQQELIKGNPFQDICNSFHNIAMQRQIAKISECVAETYQVVRQIEQGQQDDRVALIDTGRKQILTAMKIKDEQERRETLRIGTNNLLLGKEQIGKALSRRAEAFEALPGSKIRYFLKTLFEREYLNKKDDEVETIQECYSMYIESTKMLGAAYAYIGETDAVEQTFNDSIDFINAIDFSKVKTIERAHSGVDLGDWFFNQPGGYIEAERQPCIESSYGFDYVQIEVSGDVLLEVMKDGREVSEEDI